MPRRLSMLLLLLMAILVAFDSAQTTSPPPSPIRTVDAAAIFRNNCAACHGLDGRGDGPVSKALKGKIPDLTDLALRNDGVFPGVHVRTIIMFGADRMLPAHGSKQMPIWGPIFHEIEFDQDLGNVRLENMIQYLQSIQRK